MKKTEEYEFTFGMKEYPFYREGMSLEEWKTEREYMATHLDDVKHCKYVPLWKQKLGIMPVRPSNNPDYDPLELKI